MKKSIVMVLTLSLLAASAAAAGTARLEQEEKPAIVLRGLEGLIIETWKLHLGDLESTRAHADFMRREDVLIEIVEADLMSGNIASYLERTVRVNRDYIKAAREQLIQQGAPAESRPAVLALKMLPVIAHELRHGITHQEIVEAAGAPVYGEFVEDEYLSYYDTILVHLEVHAKFPLIRKFKMPAISRTEDTLIALWNAGPKNIEQYIRKHYAAAPSLFAVSDEQLTAYYQAGLDHPDTPAAYKGYLKSNVEFFRDPDKTGKQRAYFAARYSEIYHDWREQFVRPKPAS